MRDCRVNDRGGGFIAFSLVATPLLAALMAPTALAQDIGDATTGDKLAETWCSNCHVVVPTARRGSSNGAPTFSAIARMTSTPPLSLRAFLQTPHNRMPDLQLSRNEIDDLIAYILSLGRK